MRLLHQLGLEFQVDGQIVSNISTPGGLLCLIGIKDSDTEKDAEYMCAGAELGCTLAAYDKADLGCYLILILHWLQEHLLLT